ncbi:hypothetical protein LCGC14_1239930 [marine sediment metagenome]|uniref:Uncharacterized protein n=1 Tax=marine sediment metagenome TaxID=412755 RepID=A0A0F9NND0_9ZZZZ
MVQPIYSFTAGGPWNKILDANSTATSFATWATIANMVATATGIIDVSINNRKKPNMVEALFFGTDAADETFNVRIGAFDPSSDETHHIGRQIAVLAATLGAAIGLASSLVDENQFFADTLDFTSGDPLARIISPGDDTVASFMFDARGAEFIRFEFDRVLAAECNGLWRYVS